jgi:hypothetical protein
MLSVESEQRLTVAVMCKDRGDLPALRQMVTTMVPRGLQFSLVRVPSIPRNMMGKISRERLAQNLSRAMQSRPPIRR